MASIVSPIWKEVRVSLGYDYARTFEIWLNTGEEPKLIYNGLAQPDPETTEVVVIPNDVCANYLKQEWTFGSLASIGQDLLVRNPNLTADVTIKSAGVADTNITFTYDWSYLYDTTPRVALAPIDTRLGENMYFPITDYQSTGSLLFWALDEKGVIYGSYSLNGDTGSVNGLLGLNKFVIYTNSRKLYPDVEGARHLRYSIVSGCNPYALFYVNAFGCWEVLRLVSGSESHNYERSSLSKKYDITNIYKSRGKVNYQNNITRQWSVGTDWLTDAGAQNISHLIGSTNVWLHDIDNGEIVPVNITDTTSENKTFRNQGRQLVRFDINLQLAQDRTRR